MSSEGRAGALFALAGGALVWVLILFSGDMFWTGLFGLLLAFVLLGLTGKRL